MDSRQRINAALMHKTPDRIPVDFGSTAVTGMHVTCVDALRKYYGLRETPVKVCEPYQMLGFIEDDLKEVIGIDTRSLDGPRNMFGFENNDWKEYTLDKGLIVLVPKKFNVTKDKSGNTYLYPEGDITARPSGKMPKDGYYFDALIRQDPVDEDNLNYEDNLEEFTPISDKDIEYYVNEIRKINKSDKAAVAGFGGTGLGDIALVPAVFLKEPKGIRDVEEWYVSLATRRDYVHAVFEKQTDIALMNLDKLKDVVLDKVDVLFICGTDFGTQTGTFCSPDTFRKLYMPYYKKLNDWIHAKTNWKTFKHSCGAVESFIPLFIESGFDILNPVQCSAEGMGPKKLKEKYGNDIVFWGAGVDTQKTLPFGTPDEVRREVLERCEIFSKNGGFVFNAIHNIQAKTPVVNIVAMIDAIKEFNGV